MNTDKVMQKGRLDRKEKKKKKKKTEMDKISYIEVNGRARSICVQVAKVTFVRSDSSRIYIRPFLRRKIRCKTPLLMKIYCLAWLPSNQLTLA